MPKIKLTKSDRVLHAETGEVLMKALLRHDVPVASSCGGEGVCGKCRLQVLSGEKNLSAPTALERSLQKKYTLDDNERISCQALICADVELDTGYW